MGVAKSTVVFHIRNILRELDLTSRHELREYLAGSA
jgi:DNA-binding CsgD family transcriptional regulator